MNPKFSIRLPVGFVPNGTIVRDFKPGIGHEYYVVHGSSSTITREIGKEKVALKIRTDLPLAVTLTAENVLGLVTEFQCFTVDGSVYQVDVNFENAAQLQDFAPAMLRTRASSFRVTLSTTLENIPLDANVLIRRDVNPDVCYRLKSKLGKMAPVDGVRLLKFVENDVLLPAAKDVQDLAVLASEPVYIVFNDHAEFVKFTKQLV